MRKFICTNCGQSWVVPAVLKVDRTPIWLCDECDAIWFGAEQPTKGAEEDLSTYLTARGLRASYAELEFLPVEDAAPPSA